MSVKKYLTLKWIDIQKGLDANEQAWLGSFIAKIAAYRANLDKTKPAENEYVTINLSDPHAVAALEAYIDSAENDPNFQIRVNLKETVKAMKDMKIKSLTKKQRQPDP